MVPMQVLRIDGIPEQNEGKRNLVCTARYSRWTFLPKNLWEQLCELSNLYFFLVGALQMVPSVSPDFRLCEVPFSQASFITYDVNATLDYCVLRGN